MQYFYFLSELSGHTNLQILYLYDFDIPELMAGHFEHLNETNLQELTIERSKLVNISAESFRGMLLASKHFICKRYLSGVLSLIFKLWVRYAAK